jgi:hypothetical protein
MNREPPTNRQFVAAVEAIYQSAAVPMQWPSTLYKIADCFGDVGAVLMYKRDTASLLTKLVLR